MKKTTRLCRRGVAGMAMGLAIGLTGCGGSGGSDENPVPPESTVSISPSEISWDISPVLDLNGDCVFNPNLYNDHTLMVTVLNQNNAPLGEVAVRMSLDLAGNTFSGLEALKLYDDANGNGVVDDPAELVTSDISPGFNTTTARYTGQKFVLLRVNLSCPYRGNLSVFAGGAFGSINIEVKEI